MNIDYQTILARSRGLLPDRYWNQLNGENIAKNYSETIRDRQQITEDETPEIHIISEVRIK